jgi:hypothetical protein
MAFSERMKDLIDQGVAASRDFAVKAGAKAQDLGERGVLLLEIKQLEGQAQKLVGRLGAEAYRSFAENGEQTVSADAPAIKTILAELSTVRETIEKKDTELKNRKI